MRDIVTFTLPEKPRSREDWLTGPEVVALCRTAWRHREEQRGAVTKRWTIRHVVPFIATAVATCTRSARIYEAPYVAEPGRPHVDLKAGRYYRSWAGEKVAENKQAPPIPIGRKLLKWSRLRHAMGESFVVEWAGRPANPKKAFNATVERARAAYPGLFKRSNGVPKKIVRHTLRHTGVTWLAMAGVDPYEICSFAGLTMETFERVYAHHHPDHMKGIMDAQGKARAKETETAE